MSVSFLCSILWDLKLLFVVVVISSQRYFLLSHIVWYLFQSHIAWYFFHNVWIIQWYDISCNPTKLDISCSLICLQQPDGCQLVQYLLTAPQPSGSQKGKKMISFGCLGKYVLKLWQIHFKIWRNTAGPISSYWGGATTAWQYNWLTAKTKTLGSQKRRKTSFYRRKSNPASKNCDRTFHRSGPGRTVKRMRGFSKMKVEYCDVWSKEP